MQKLNVRLWAGAVLLSLGTWGCASMDSTPVRGAAGDAALATQIRERLQADAVTASSVIGVQVRNGFVVLQGQVPGGVVRARALSIVKGTEGVIQVEDRIYSPQP